MKPKTEELLYLLLWSCDMMTRPTFRNLTDSFESWAYRNGFRRQLAELGRQRLLESSPTVRNSGSKERVLRLTEAGRLHALGGRDPEIRWRRKWDGRWRLVLFDLPLGENTARDRLRLYLKKQGFGYLQQSVWISPDPLQQEKEIVAGSRVDVRSLILLEARPGAGETDQEIVVAAWDFPEINRRHGKHAEVLAVHPNGPIRDHTAAHSFRKWAAHERAAWLAAMEQDPLLPEVLLPQGYSGRKTWQMRLKVLRQAAEQMRTFQALTHNFA